MDITGTIVAGLGEGAKYVKLYNPYILEALGYEAFPGTLNIAVPGGTGSLFENAITIAPKEEGLFPIHAKLAVVNAKLRGAVIRPVKTAHGDDIVEVIAPQSIKEHFSLANGDQVTVTV